MTAPRFTRISVVWDLPAIWCETAYLTSALAEIERLLGDHEIASRFTFVVTSYGDRVAMKHAERVIVIQTSDEGHEIPTYLGDVFMVFKMFRPFAPMPDNLRILPAGCNKDVPAIPGKPMALRGTDVFFSGRKDHREDFFARALSLNARRDLTARIEISSDFRSGIAPALYADILADTKIALCPRGVTHETFRLYEAMRAGCAIVAIRQMPNWFTDGWPVIEVDDWNDIDAIIDALLRDPERLEDLSRRNLMWWQTRCSPEMVGRYIVNEIVGRLMRDQ